MEQKIDLRSLLRSIIKRLCRFYPLYSGCGTIANTPFFQSLSQIPNPLVMTRLRDGSNILVRLDDYVGRAIYYFGDLDPKITWVCKKLLRPGDIVLDVGANCGLVTLYASKLVGATGHVHAFEPQPDLAELIQKSVGIGGCSQVSVHNIALSENDGFMNMVIPTDNSGAASLSRQTAFPSKMIQVQVRRTADYLSGLNLGAVRLMKLDVEGHEEAVLQGARDFFRDRGPDVIVFESNNSSVFKDSKSILEQPTVRLLESIGYIIFEIPKLKFRMRLRKLDRETNYQINSHDFVAIKCSDHYVDLTTALHFKPTKLKKPS